MSCITAVSEGYSHVLALRRDGTVAVCGLNNCGQCDVQDWKNIMAVAAGEAFTLGLKRDGTVVVCGNCRTMPVLRQAFPTL